ncbi:hypothetical protein PoB_001804000 [Plakobranchus ocellatus]|uniref:Uncharacterized protein n=1 Tax=Plakobranchus ocellatus TaxID=259542 RepID=A0AAV3Z7R0_9GAST|nr:hypothetical protein PoB_001804000 [Plakobranchus ocellatus]
MSNKKLVPAGGDTTLLLWELSSSQHNVEFATRVRHPQLHPARSNIHGRVLFNASPQQGVQAFRPSDYGGDDGGRTRERGVPADFRTVRYPLCHQRLRSRREPLWPGRMD